MIKAALKKAHPVIILTTLPDIVAAEKLAFVLVEQKLAVCVNILPEVKSIYFWDGKLVRDKEVKLMAKTSSAAEEKAVAFIKANHPYSVPEITRLGGKGDVWMQPDYWEWLTGYVKGD